MGSGVTSVPQALPPVLRWPAGMMAVFGALVAAGLAVLASVEAAPGRIDLWVEAADAVRPPMRYVALVIDFGGEPLGAMVLLVVLVAACLVLGRRRTAMLAVAGTGLTVAATTALKPVVGRRIHGEFLSYPSGHTALATALALVLALLAVDLLLPGRRSGFVLVMAAALVAAVAMGWSQVALGAHFPTDTVGGFCTALAVVPPTAWLVDRVADRSAGAR